MTDAAVPEDSAPGPFSFTLDDVPDLTGRVMVVTGASSGLGAVAAQVLAEHGAQVVMAVRDVAKGERVRAAFSPEAASRAVVRPVDLFELSTVHALADAVLDEHDRIDVLLNNAGVGSEPHRLSREGVDGVFAANVIGPHLLTQRLLGAIDRAPDGRVVTVSSGLYRRIKVELPIDATPPPDTDAKRYAASKLANVLLATELERRLRARGARARSLLVHPGVALTPMSRQARGVGQRIAGRLLGLALGRPVEVAVLPLLFAAVHPEAPVDRFLGPAFGKRDRRVHADRIVAPGDDRGLAARLWAYADHVAGLTEGAQTSR